VKSYQALRFHRFSKNVRGKDDYDRLDGPGSGGITSVIRGGSDLMGRWERKEEGKGNLGRGGGGKMG